jgi:hypothetical protein
MRCFCFASRIFWENLSKRKSSYGGDSLKF